MNVDLNADLGEGMGHDLALLELVTSANVACGGHAGDRESMTATVAAAVRRGVAVGAHLSYPDPAGFGRTYLPLPQAALEESLANQLDVLCAIAQAHDVSVAYVKPHGALYNRIVEDADHAAAVVAVCSPKGLPVMGLPGSAVLRLAEAAGLATITEAFADRAYTAAATLVPRSSAGAVLEEAEQVADRVARLVTTGRLTAVTGEEIDLRAQSICVHGDTPGAVEMAAAVRSRLLELGVTLAPAVG